MPPTTTDDGFGTVWEYTDSFAFRLPGITAGKVLAFDPAEWNISRPNTLDGADAAGIAAAGTPGSHIVTALVLPCGTGVAGRLLGGRASTQHGGEYRNQRPFHARLLCVVSLRFEDIRGQALSGLTAMRHRACHYKPEPMPNTQAGLNALLVTTGLKGNSRIYNKVDKELRQVGKYLLRRWKHFNLPRDSKSKTVAA